MTEPDRAARHVREIAVRWRGDLRFESGDTHGRRPSILVDGESAAALSPIELLLVAAATCTASDVVVILQKQRVILRSLEVAVRGTRREQEPRRYTDLHFRFELAGEGADETRARRAIDLSLEKYCSVVASLATDIRITYDLAVA
jgi:putative redox protein